jgi:hypothetical protein
MGCKWGLSLEPIPLVVAAIRLLVGDEALSPIVVRANIIKAEAMIM